MTGKATDQLFLDTLRDLETRIVAQDPYTILGAAALIRKLLLDDHPLVHQVNRAHRLRLSFEPTKRRAIPPGVPEPVLWATQDGFDPDTAPPFLERQTVNLEQLLACVLLTVRGQPFTLREIVQFEAHVMGAVHAGTPKEEKERALVEINRYFAIGGYRTSLRQLRAISRVILKGLAPLRAAIETKK
jgi:hypothetical protein